MQQLTRDLRFYCAFIVLPAVVLAVGVVLLLHLEFARAQEGVAEARHERGESYARSLHQTIKDKTSLSERVEVLDGLLEDEDRVMGAFVWRKGDGVLWQDRIPAAVAASLEPDMRWSAQRKSGFSAPRGWFVPAAEPEKAIAWTRLGGNEVSGLLIDMRDDLVGGNLFVLFVASACLVLFLFASLSAGGLLLARAARRARTESARKTTFIDNLSHELKVPLAVVRMKAERLLAGKVTDPEKLRAAYRTIADENGEVIRQVDDLLDLVRTGKGTRRYACRPFDLNLAVSEAASSLRDRFAQDGLDVRLADEKVRVDADPDAVRQIVRNLLDNAAKYAAGSGPVEVSVSRADGRAVVAVADRGAGIPPDQHERIFERFYRIDNDLTRTTGGTGIGLCLARCFARDMGGDVTVAARPGGGSVFSLELPEEMHG